MEYTGVLFRFKLNRCLTAAERNDQLLVARSAHSTPYDELSLTRMNSTFVEIVDRQFRYVGFMTLISGTCFLLCVVAFASIVWDEVVRQLVLGPGHLKSPVWFVLYTTALFAAVGAVCAWFVGREVFAYTHYPIRLNRRTRMVHAWRPQSKGGVLSVKWDDVFWHIGESQSKGIGGRCWDVRGHVLDAQGQVKDTFVVGPFNYDRDFVKHQWEFYRRYMQEGPQALPPVHGFLRVHDRRERLLESIQRSWYLAGTGVVMVLMLPITTLIGLARWFAMHTSRIPQWPPEIEAACAIEPGDPYWYEPDEKGCPRKMASAAQAGPPRHR